MQTAPNSGTPAMLATDPPVSEKQRKAMYAALNGRSTLGIPKSVASKFVGPGAHDISPEDWNRFYASMRDLTHEEPAEQAEDIDDPHRAAGVALRDPDKQLLFVKRSVNGDNAGTWAFPGGYAHQGENEEAAAIRELQEEIGFLLRQPLRVRFDSAESDAFKYTTFVHDVDHFVPELNDESDEYVWATPDQAPQPLHPGVIETLNRMRADDCQAYDERYAFDRATVRRTDHDGRLHVDVTNISKANVCPYLGREIPDWQALGLQEDRVYNLLRDPEELRKAAPTFNNIPLLIEHKAVSAEDHQPDLVIGSTGTDSEFSHPYLKNSLVVWVKDAIDAIESGLQKELSSAYRYRADMTPGNYQGSDYDGIMRDIVGNHVALVKEGRAGTDVVVGDSKAAVIAQQQEEKRMSIKKLSPIACFMQGALTTFLAPKLAQDAKLPDMVPLLQDVTAKNFADQKPKLLEGLMEKMKGILAKDANLEDMHGFIDRLDKMAGEEEKASDEDMDEEEKKKGAFDEEQSNGLREFLKDKLSEDDMNALNAYMAGDEPPAFAGSPVKEQAQDEKKDEVMDKQAMDEAIKVAADSATKKAIQTQREIREAEKFVRPWVGELPGAFDSAEGVHRAAAKILGIDGADKLHPEALPHVIKAQPKPGDEPRQTSTVAMDSATISDFNTMFPNAARIGILG